MQLIQFWLPVPHMIHIRDTQGESSFLQIFTIYHIINILFYFWFC